MTTADVPISRNKSPTSAVMNKRVQTGRRMEVLAQDETLPDRFKRVARSHTSRAALASETRRPTYGELDAASDLWAQAIAARGGDPGDRVAILMRHDPHQVAVVLAVLVTLRFHCELDKTLRAWMMTTRNNFTSAIAHSEVPYEELRRSF